MESKVERYYWGGGEISAYVKAYVIGPFGAAAQKEEDSSGDQREERSKEEKEERRKEKERKKKKEWEGKKE